VPAVGERFDIDGLAVEVLDAERRRINKVRVSKRAGTEEQEAQESTIRSPRSAI
jgi:CBS domain containing-hemolysin-like protein